MATNDCSIRRPNPTVAGILQVPHVVMWREVFRMPIREVI